MADEDSTEEVPQSSSGSNSQLNQQQRGVWLQFLKMAVSAADLTSLSCPTFLLEPMSLLEHETGYMCYPEIFFDIRKHEDPVRRILAVTRWWMATLWTSFGYPLLKKSLRKPYNPVLGEQLKAKWENPDSEWKTCTMIAEQVSHHPPISAYYFENAAEGMCVFGYLKTTTKLRGTSIRVQSVGRVVLRIQKYEDEYILDYPDMQLRGIMTGHIFPEITGPSSIRSLSGYTVYLDHQSKPWFGGEYHLLKGTVYKTEEGPSHPLSHISGKWTGVTTATSPSDPEDTIELFDASEPPTFPFVAPLEQQESQESQKVWHKVSEALLSQDYSAASREKTTIEEQQRSLRRQREAEGTTWVPKHFHWVPDERTLEEKFGEGLWAYKDVLPLKAGHQSETSSNSSVSSSESPKTKPKKRK